ncbi:MAG TPA: ATP-binding cassette domain-containing protein, partial [Paracoccus sp. (in: a-proteobacteria)]|uniref:ATP-binding cassette domain-containing protein n=1 Tax=Paracoccus sp. TaxID=267 RepID=UPI002BF42139
EDFYPPKGNPGHEPALEVSDLTVPGEVHGVNLTLCKGEVLGIAGLVGSGRTELAEGLVGLRPARAGVRIDGRPVTLSTLRDAFAAGLAYLTEDRKEAGLLLEKGLTENLTLATLDRFGGWRIDNAAEIAAYERAKQDFDIRAPRRDMPAGKLSGGNQQKLLLAKTMLPDPRIIIIDEPTRGIDVGTKRQIYAFIRKLAEEGRSIIVISSEMSEIIGLSDRVLVMREGRVAGELAGPMMTEENIVRLAMGVKEAA